jgi:DNA-binding HxlR family transcriptional regulator
MTAALAAAQHDAALGRSAEDRFARYLAPGTCALLRDAFDRIGDKWSLLVVAHLALGPRRFGRLLRGIEGISQRMLTLTLRRLERDGLVTRTAFLEIPPRVEYELTELGLTLVETVASMADWAIEHQPAIVASRARFDQGGPGSTGDEPGEPSPRAAN